MKKKIPLFIKFDTYVPTDVIDSLYRILETYKQHYSQDIKLVLNNFSPVIEVHDLQYPKHSTTSVRMIEELKLANTWLFENDDVAKVQDFISQHFSSAFQFRIDILAANSKLGWHSNHAYPRVFIPMHHNLCTFNIRENNVIIGNQYQLNEMWMWDVRKWHCVDNSLSTIPRIMAAFSIDPDTETKINFDNYTNK